MECPNCGIDFDDEWTTGVLSRSQKGPVPYKSEKEQAAAIVVWGFHFTVCTRCKEPVLEIGPTVLRPAGVAAAHAPFTEKWERVFPQVGKMPQPHPSIPKGLAEDYCEAHLVLSFSAKASAALSRRCLQGILDDKGYPGRDLSQQIERMLSEPDATKSIPSKLRMTVDSVRNFGNFSAHPINDQTTLQIIPVEPHEAEWCLETISELFDHFYVGPEIAKQKKAELDAKLTRAGKPLSKG